MKTIYIESASNQKLKLIRSLHSPSNTNPDKLILVEGHKLMEEALKNNIKLQDIVVSQSYLQDSFNKTDLAKHIDSLIVVSDNLFKGLYTTDTSCGIIATAVPKVYELNSVLASCKTIVISDGIQDPGNLGTMIRTAFAFNADAILCSKGTVDCYSPKVIRSSMGAIFSMPVFKSLEITSLINDLKQQNIHTVALEGKAKQSIWQLSIQKPVAYILGNEGHGISPQVLNLVHEAASIPINPKCESLNVAIAAAIILVRDQFK